MRIALLFLAPDLPAAIRFYTEVLDFALAADASALGATLLRGDVELMLTALASDQVPRVNAYLIVEDIDALFARWSKRGLDQSRRRESPVHLAPFDQTWGTRELYVTDPAGNTLRVVQRRPPR